MVTTAMTKCHYQSSPITKITAKLILYFEYTNYLSIKYLKKAFFLPQNPFCMIFAVVLTIKLNQLIV